MEPKRSREPIDAAPTVPPADSEGVILEAVSIALRVARSAGLCREDREDVAQEVVTRLLPARSRVRNPRAWCRRVTFIVIRELRARAVLARSVSAVPVQCVDPSGGWERSIDLGCLLDGLDARFQRVLRMTLAGATHAEIAGCLGVPIGCVGTLVARARARAREAWIALAGGAVP